MTNKVPLPELPEPVVMGYYVDSVMRKLERHGYTSDHMREYGEQCARAAIRQALAPVVAKPRSDYHEDHGPVVWWTWCDGKWLGEPAWCGTPNDSDWPCYHTHWTPHPTFPTPPEAD